MAPDAGSMPDAEFKAKSLESAKNPIFTRGGFAIFSACNRKRSY
jgi:hypothetical protein